MKEVVNSDTETRWNDQTVLTADYPPWKSMDRGLVLLNSMRPPHEFREDIAF